MGGLSESLPLLLGSRSPRRRELLERLGIPTAVVAVDVDERVGVAEEPHPYLERVVSSKLAALHRVAGRPHAARLVADTVVAVDGEILDKPNTHEDRVAAIRRIAGRVHQVMTRFALQRASDHAVLARTVTTQVFVRPLPETWIERYAASGDGADKAGGYGIQGWFALAIPRIEGSYSNVVGLPQCEVVQALEDLDLTPSSLGP